MDIPNLTAPSRSIGSTLGLKFYRLRTLLRRHWWIPLLTVCLGLAYQGWVVSRKPDLYESTSQISVREQLDNLDETSIKFRESTDTFLGNTLKMLQGPDIHRAARERLEMEAPELGAPEVSVEPMLIPRTSIFSIVGSGTNPEYTRRYVDTVVASFIASRQQVRGQAITDVAVDITGELATYRREHAKEKAELDAFIEKNNMHFWKEQATSSATFLADLKTRQAKLKTELQRLENLTPEQLLNSGPSAPAAQRSAGGENVDPSQGEGGVGNELYGQYLQANNQLAMKRAEMEERSTVWKDAHPRMKALKMDLARAERQIEFLKKQSAGAAQARIATIKAELMSLESGIADWSAKVEEASRKDAEYQRLQAAVARTQGLQEKLIAQMDKIKIGSGINAGGLQVVQKATPPAPVPKGAVKHLLIGLIGGLLVGGAILFFLDKSDDRLSSSTEMIEHFSEPILGQIPNVTDTRKESGLPLLQPEDERYSYAEAFRSLRSSLIFMPNQEELKTLLITSAIPNEGKSTVASNLAVTMAASGARVLLVDADLRRGDLAALFDTDGRHGLSSILRGEVPWKSALQSTPYPTLTLIPRGPVTNQSGELLLKPMMEKMLEEFKEEYDLVIFNTAPILATDDTPTLAPHFDGTLMVIRAQFTSARLTQNSLNALYQRQVNVLGLILNCVDTEMPDYYYYRYPKYYAA
ncbi:MAG TPA: polysaccharide biosynthesis tyrosine autokinase [Chthoniobacteraceae bacterium]|jgi:capsular exopolysaccharide synthesis family protein